MERAGKFLVKVMAWMFNCQKILWNKGELRAQKGFKSLCEIII